MHWNKKDCHGIAVDAVFDSVSVATTFKDEVNLGELGIIFCSISEAVIREHPELSKKYLGSVIPHCQIIFCNT